MSEQTASGSSSHSDPEKWPEKVDRNHSIVSSDGDSEIEPVESHGRQYQDVLRYGPVMGIDDKILTPQVSRLSHNSLARKVTSVGTTGTTDPNFEVDWEDENDPENPWNWSLGYTAMCVTFLSWNTLVMCVGVQSVRDTHKEVALTLAFTKRPLLHRIHLGHYRDCH